ncbi:MAG: hypothetical protein H8D34_13935 [Chloroflexi bacterium]|nr:hypothetical protein [Chloroflexota bacterium]
MLKDNKSIMIIICFLLILMLSCSTINKSFDGDPVPAQSPSDPPNSTTSKVPVVDDSNSPNDQEPSTPNDDSDNLPSFTIDVPDDYELVDNNHNGAAWHKFEKIRSETFLKDVRYTHGVQIEIGNEADNLSDYMESVISAEWTWEGLHDTRRQWYLEFISRNEIIVDGKNGLSYEYVMPDADRRWCKVKQARFVHFDNSLYVISGTYSESLILREDCLEKIGPEKLSEIKAILDTFIFR